ncbi:hypothetical protein BBBOND_0310400 [Babesia bigemina]|uniref:Uncharacterized protein n=1 Tax=Babesia bigemina TaxID=5866 RepID=A0A061DAW4_BABBI|nr:hypothetical protein BBBOND_0310400 [Babesia bigemina]CDR97137.1 hypothetical protein BBBOND_0310400 [Babesia bigemina]|eukprot:XP_012769323.1 hypothetical protein BBBOND_0310400 [Babesia bigemina]
MVDSSSANLASGSNVSSTRSAKTQGSVKAQRQQDNSDELQFVKQHQGINRTRVNTTDVDVILEENAKLIQQLRHPHLTKDSYRYVQTFAQLQRNLVFIARLADQPR